MDWDDIADQLDDLPLTVYETEAVDFPISNEVYESQMTIEQLEAAEIPQDLIDIYDEMDDGDYYYIDFDVEMAYDEGEQ
jgi:hypothetical protein